MRRVTSEGSRVRGLLIFFIQRQSDEESRLAAPRLLLHPSSLPHADTPLPPSLTPPPPPSTLPIPPADPPHPIRPAVFAPPLRCVWSSPQRLDASHPRLAKVSTPPHGALSSIGHPPARWCTSPRMKCGGRGRRPGGVRAHGVPPRGIAQSVHISIEKTARAKKTAPDQATSPESRPQLGAHSCGDRVQESGLEGRQRVMMDEFKSTSGYFYRIQGRKRRL